MVEKLRELFRRTYGREAVTVAFAPGRIEVIGNHTDYNGGPVIGAAIDRGVWVAIAGRPDGRRRLASDQSAEPMQVVDMPAQLFEKRKGEEHWVNYPLGVISALPYFGFQQPDGFDYLALSNLPVGAGLSSSAAIELASALAFLALTEQSCSREQLAQIGRKAENEFVGVPCGILDQGVSAFGEVDHLVEIDCRELVFKRIPFGGETSLWIFNTHAKHALVDGLYAQRHRECQLAAFFLGAKQLVDVQDRRWEVMEKRMPVEPARRARHVLGEIDRVRQVQGLLKRGALAEVGKLLTESHHSSQRYFQNSTPELDFLVDALLPAPGVYGARLTGGGFGGAVLALTGPEFTTTDADIVHTLYKKRYQAAPDIFKFRCGRGAHVVDPQTDSGRRVAVVSEEARS
jgi:galactokinase